MRKLSILKAISLSLVLMFSTSVIGPLKSFAKGSPEVNQEFIISAMACALNEMINAIEMGADINSIDLNDNTALHILASSTNHETDIENRCLELASYLLKLDGIWVNALNKFGYTPLLKACATGNDKFIRLLLQTHDNIDVFVKIFGSLTAKKMIKASKNQFTSPTILEEIDELLDKAEQKQRERDSIREQDRIEYNEWLQLYKRHGKKLKTD